MVPLRLEPVGEGPPRPRAVLVPWAQSGWLRRLLFALPASALRSYRVAFLEVGVLVLAGERMEGFPFGQLLEELIPGALVPVGTRLRPALSPDLLAERLGISEGSLCVFPALEAPPFRVARESFELLERRALARSDIPWATPADAQPVAGGHRQRRRRPPGDRERPAGDAAAVGLSPLSGRTSRRCCARSSSRFLLPLVSGGPLHVSGGRWTCARRWGWPRRSECRPKSAPRRW